MAPLSVFAIILAMSVGMCLCAPTLYEVDEQLGEANPVMIPVSSTAIPLDDLPVFKVGFGFGSFGKNKSKYRKQKPSNLRDIQLITAKNQHRFILTQKIAPAGVQELTKEEFEKFNNQA
jgi:hypothetical protein